MKIKEENYIRELKKHNEKALDYLIERYGGLLASIIKKHLYSMKDRQEECLNDVLMGIWENIGYFDETKNSFKNWIAGIARYKSMDYLRKYLKDLQQVSWDEVVIQEEDQALEQLLNAELSEELEMMLDCLKPQDQELFRKLFFEGKEAEEVSLETGIKKEVIYNRVSRGKKRIRQKCSHMKGVQL